MKKYLIQKTLEAEPMLKTEAEARLGHEIEVPKNDNVGYLYCDMSTLKWVWIPESRFDGKPFNSILEQLMVFDSQLKYWQNFFLTYSKEKGNVAIPERQQIYRINRHLKLFVDAIQKVININQLQKTDAE